MFNNKTSSIKVDFKLLTREITKFIFFMREFTVFDIQEHLESVFKNGYYLENRRKPETNPGYRRIQEIRKILERYFLVIHLNGSRPFRGKLYKFN